MVNLTLLLFMTNRDYYTHGISFQIIAAFLKLLTGSAGQLINYQLLSNEVGVDSKTIKQWLSILEASFVIFKLPPYFENFGKRVIKSPKYYFTDIGLLTCLLDIEKPAQVSRDPLVGSLFENLVIIGALSLLKEISRLI